MEGIIVSMKTSVKKTVAALAALSFIAPVAACHKTQGSDAGAGEAPVSGEVISADTLWYDMTDVRISEVDNPDDFQWTYSKYIGSINNQFVYYTSGLFNFLEGVDDSNYTDDYCYDCIDVYSEDGTKTATFDLRELLNSSSIGEHNKINSVFKAGDRILVNISAYDEEYTTSVNYRTYVDVAANTVDDIVEADNPFADELFELGASEESPITINGYLIQPYWVCDTVNSYILIITDPDGNMTKVDLRSSMPTVSLWSLSGAMDLGNNKIVIYGTSENGNAFIDLDLTDMTAGMSEQDYSWIGDSISSLTSVDGLGTVIVDGTTISKVDPVNCTIEEVFNFSNSNANIAEVLALEPVYVSEDKVILTGDATIINPETLVYEGYKVIKVFNKAETNPNAGKTCLTLTSADGCTLGLCTAICEFNENSNGYFVVTDTRYELGDYVDYTDANTSLEIDTAYDNGLVQLGNQLAIDVMSGEGPDILIGSSNSFTQLNNPDNLVDLNDYVQNNLTEDKYMRNVIGACYTGDAIYQLPFNYTVRGIVTDASNVADGQVGLTFDQYATFVDEVCNGTDPVAQHKLDFFIICMGSMMDLMQDENGNLNFDNDAFRALAEYTSEHVLDVNVESDDYLADSSSEVETRSVIFYRPDDYFDYCTDGDTLVGLPSYDGRGPVIDVGLSVGISTQSASIDGCMEFIDYLMSPQVQMLLSWESGFPVNRESAEAMCNHAIELHNEYIQEQLESHTEAEIRSWGYNPVLMDSSFTEAFTGFVNSLGGNSGSGYDGAINIIIREEMPSYFEGQKSLDEVITVIQDRAQTVVSERS